MLRPRDGCAARFEQQQGDRGDCQHHLQNQRQDHDDEDNKKHSYNRFKPYHHHHCPAYPPQQQPSYDMSSHIAGSEGSDHTQKMEDERIDQQRREPPQVSELIFMGTGTSGNVPNINCLTKPHPNCKTCIAALQTSSPSPKVGRGGWENPPVPQLPVMDKNRRRNTGAVVRYLHSDGRTRTILIDCGKTFYESALYTFLAHSLRQIDAVILTHGHADAMLGLDDLRMWTIGGGVQSSIDVWCDKKTMGVVESTFPYLVDRDKATGGGDVPKLLFNVFDSSLPSSEEGQLPPSFVIEELTVQPLPVVHGVYSDGSPYPSLGFRFGDNLTYISDCSAIPESTRRAIRGSTKVLVMDALHCTYCCYCTVITGDLQNSNCVERVDEPHPSHFSVSEAVTACIDLLGSSPTTTTTSPSPSPSSTSITPRRAYLTGFSHRVHHETLEREMAEHEGVRRVEGLTIQVAWDGLKVLV
ncbi:beta-lactamase-like protein [Phlyctochytrium arcticum]|nr:beta-lactamase-like protein [Phlyctochytrium arcticum]